jgi:hypothetical protein
MLTLAKISRGLPLLAAAMVFLAGTWALADTTLEGDVVSPMVPTVPTRDAPTLVMSFHDPIQAHCMGITSDGSYYYTINGGNATWGEIRTYDLSGNPVLTVACAIDARSISFNPADGYFYAKTYYRDWCRVDPATGSFSTVFAGIFQSSQSSPALTPDGDYILEHESGTLYWYDAHTGAMITTMSGFYHGASPSSGALATDGCRLFTWDGSLTYVYDMQGTFIESWNVPSGNYGFSPAWANGLFWTSDDTTDMWYGYDVGNPPSPAEETTWGAIKALYR